MREFSPKRETSQGSERAKNGKEGARLPARICPDEWSGSYQLLLVTPGIIPFEANSRKEIRDSPKRRK